MTHRTRVLVVDDDLDALYYVDDLLSELGYYPIKTTSVEDAAEIVGAMQLDAMIVNAAMIPTASEEALAQLERMPGTTSVLIMSEPVMRPDAASAAPRDFMEHPPELVELAEVLQRRTPAIPQGER
jgi:CheY-like chemotaxis protein